VIVKSLSYILLLMVPEQVWDWHFCSYWCVCFFCFLSPLVWFFLWLPEEVLALLFLLHRENRDFSILMKDIWLCSSGDLDNKTDIHQSFTITCGM
jgi:hypothetical protein